MTPEQRASLKAAVDNLNAVMADIIETSDGTTRVRPWVNYADGSHARVQVEITTGRELFGGEE